MTMAGKRIFCDYERCRAGEHVFKLCFSSVPQAGLVPIPIVKLGTYRKGSAPFTIGPDDIEHLVENFRKPGSGGVPVNYEQVNEWPNLLQKGTVPTAGWLKEIDDHPDKDGVLWGQADLTEKAGQLIVSQGYKYLLPTLRYDLRDARTFELQGMTLTALTLTKNPPFLAPAPAFSETAPGKTVFNDYDKLDHFLSDEARRRMKASGITFAEAFNQLRRESPNLFELRHLLASEQGRPGNSSAMDATLRDVGHQIQAHIKATMAQRTGLTYGAALRLALSERPELFAIRDCLQSRGAR